jgi:hypothetical protein
MNGLPVTRMFVTGRNSINGGTLSPFGSHFSASVAQVDSALKPGDYIPVVLPQFIRDRIK